MAAQGRVSARGRRDGRGGRPKERVGCGQKRDCTRGLGQPGGGRGLPETCVLVTECGVYHLLLLPWPSARTPTPSSGRARPKGWSTGLRGSQALPCGTWDLRGGWQAGPRGRQAFRAAPAPACSPSGALAGSEAPRGAASLSPLLHCHTEPVAFSSRLWYLWEGSRHPLPCHLGPG